MARVTSKKLVGRRDELAALGAQLTAAESGIPSLTWVRGEAGIGKTRLLRELEAHARRQGALVLRGCCLQLSGGEFPYAPIVGALRSADRGVVEHALASLPPDGRAEIVRLVPELGAQHAPAAPADSEGGLARARLFELLLGLIRRLADIAPVLVVIEDAHWADTSTRDFIVYVAANLSAERLALAVSYRSDEVTRDHPLAAVVAALDRHPEVAALELLRLSREEVEQQLDDILGGTAGHTLVDDIFRQAQGVPYYVEELLAARRAGRDTGLDETLAQALLARVDALSSEVRAVLQALAAIGRPATEPLLHAVMGTTGLSQALHEAVDSHVVRRRPGDTFEFRHALTRDAVAGDLMPGERVALHGAIARALLDAGEANPAELAFHWEAAGDRAAALDAHIDAGVEAGRVYAFGEAHEHFECALALSDAGPASMDRIELLRRLAEAKRLLGDPDGAVSLVRRALTMIDAEAEPLRAAMLHERVGAYLFWDDETALASYDEALRLLPADCDVARARILAARAATLHDLQRWDEALEQAKEAMRIAEAAGAPGERAHAHIALGTALAFLGDPEAGERHVRRARELAEAGGSAADRGRVFSHLAEVLRLQGRVDKALNVMLEGEQTCARLGMSRSLGLAMAVNAAEDLLWLGRWDEAAERLRASARRELSDASRVLHETVSGQLAVARGDVAAARTHLERAAAVRPGEMAPDYLTAVHAGWAELALWEGRPEDAWREIATGLEALDGAIDPLYAPSLHALGCRAAADATLMQRPGPERARLRDPAHALLAQLEALAHGRGLAHTDAYVALCRAELARLARTPGVPAVALWEDVAARWTALAHPYPAAYARWRQGEAMLHQRGLRREAAVVLSRAHTAADELGALPLLRAIDALARVARLSLDAPLSAPEPTPAESLGLTPRELEVLSLIAAGWTNRDIAERLVISANTARVHVSHILTKLGVSRRVDAATAAYRLGLLEPVDDEALGKPT